MATTTRRGWYDGWFYALLIDNGWIEYRRRMKMWIPDGRRVLDVCCGTGGFVLDLAPRSAVVQGVDISQKMIAIARRRQQKSSLSNVDFVHADATRLSDVVPADFDVATVSLALHEMAPEPREVILREMATVAQKVIILDYSAPQPQSFAGFTVRLVEFFAGREHYLNFRQYVRSGGLSPLLRAAGLHAVDHQHDRTETLITVSAMAEENSSDED